MIYPYFTSPTKEEHERLDAWQKRSLIHLLDKTSKL